jgi:hypothetical protein
MRDLGAADQFEAMCDAAGCPRERWEAMCHSVRICQHAILQAGLHPIIPNRRVMIQTVKDISKNVPSVKGPCVHWMHVVQVLDGCLHGRKNVSKYDAMQFARAAWMLVFKDQNSNPTILATVRAKIATDDTHKYETELAKICVNTFSVRVPSPLDMLRHIWVRFITLTGRRFDGVLKGMVEQSYHLFGCLLTEVPSFHRSTSPTSKAAGVFMFVCHMVGLVDLHNACASHVDERHWHAALHALHHFQMHPLTIFPLPFGSYTDMVSCSDEFLRMAILQAINGMLRRYVPGHVLLPSH